MANLTEKEEKRLAKLVCSIWGVGEYVETYGVEYSQTGVKQPERVELSTTISANVESVDFSITKVHTIMTDLISPKIGASPFWSRFVSSVRYKCKYFSGKEAENMYEYLKLMGKSMNGMEFQDTLKSANDPILDRFISANPPGRNWSR